MEFKEVVKERYACKGFCDKKVPKEKVEAILEAGRLAPTAKNLQEQKILVLESEKALKIVDEVTPCRYGAPTVLAVCYDKNNVFTYPGGKLDSGMEDATIVATHMMLAAKDEGVESCWLNYYNPEVLREKLELPENYEVIMLLDLGYAREGVGPLANHGSRKPLSETVTWL